MPTEIKQKLIFSYKYRRNIMNIAKTLEIQPGFLLQLAHENHGHMEMQLDICFIFFDYASHYKKFEEALAPYILMREMKQCN